MGPFVNLVFALVLALFVVIGIQVAVYVELSGTQEKIAHVECIEAGRR